MRALVLLLLASGCARWSRLDTALQVTAAATLAVDWHQTSLGMSTDGIEQNPMTRAAGPDLYFAGVAVAHVLAATLLPPRWRTAFQAATIGVELDVARRNCGEGYCW